MRRSNRLVLLVGAVVALALPAIAGAQVTPFRFVDDDVALEFAPAGGGVAHTFDLRSFLRLDAPGTFNPAAVGATLTISQGGVTLFSLPVPAQSGWRTEDKRIRFDGVVAGVDLSVDFRVPDGTTFLGSLPAGTRIAFDTEGDLLGSALVIPCVDGAVTTTIGLQIESFGDETTVPAACD